MHEFGFILCATMESSPLLRGIFFPCRQQLSFRVTAIGYNEMCKAVRMRGAAEFMLIIVGKEDGKGISWSLGVLRYVNLIQQSWITIQVTDFEYVTEDSNDITDSSMQADRYYVLGHADRNLLALSTSALVTGEVYGTSFKMRVEAVSSNADLTQRGIHRSIFFEDNAKKSSYQVRMFYVENEELDSECQMLFASSASLNMTKGLVIGAQLQAQHLREWKCFDTNQFKHARSASIHIVRECDIPILEFQYTQPRSTRNKQAAGAVAVQTLRIAGAIVTTMGTEDELKAIATLGISPFFKRIPDDAIEIELWMFLNEVHEQVVDGQIVARGKYSSDRSITSFTYSERLISSEEAVRVAGKNSLITEKTINGFVNRMNRHAVRKGLSHHQSKALRKSEKEYPETLVSADMMLGTVAMNPMATRDVVNAVNLGNVYKKRTRESVQMEDRNFEKVDFDNKSDSKSDSKPSVTSQQILQKISSIVPRDMSNLPRKVKPAPESSMIVNRKERESRMGVRPEQTYNEVPLKGRIVSFGDAAEKKLKKTKFCGVVPTFEDLKNPSERPLKIRIIAPSPRAMIPSIVASDNPSRWATAGIKN